MFILQQNNKWYDVTKQGFCKILRRKLSVFGEVLISNNSILWVGGGRGWGGGGCLFEFEWEGDGVG